MTAATPMRRTYVGVTGYPSLASAQAVHAATGHLVGSRRVMDGYLMWAHDVSPRWRATSEAPANYGNRFLSVEAARTVFSAPPNGSLRLVHLRTNVHHALDEQLGDLIGALGRGIDGFQINWVAHPSPRELGEFRAVENAARAPRGLPDLTVVLQLHPGVLASADTDRSVVRYVSPYVEAEAITHALFDPSGGQGKAFDVTHALATVRALRTAFPTLNVGIAGGLSPENVRDIVRPIWEADPFVSIDVESKVRDAATDHFDVGKAIRYVTAALELSKTLTVDPGYQVGG